MCWVLFLCFASVTWAQDNPIQLVLDPAYIGIGGVIRPGSWMPTRLVIDNSLGPTRQVVVGWSLKDMDQDTVFAQRKTTLTAGRMQNVWLYAVPPLQTKPKDIWTFWVRDELTGEMLVQGPFQINQVAPTTTTLIATTGSRSRLGLEPYTQKLGGTENVPYTQHESVYLIRGFQPDQMPDRWFGYDGLNMLIWTPDSPDPGSPLIPPSALQALRQWVMQGGHLVISIPVVGELWTSSDLADLLPEVDMQPIANQLAPQFLGLKSDVIELDMMQLTPRPGSDVAILATDDFGKVPLIVTQQRGFGRVTLIGIDLSSRQLGVLPNGAKFWHAIANWQSPAFRPEIIKDMLEKQTMAPIFNRSAGDMGTLVGPQVAMKGTYNTALLLAMLLFAAYWLISGPVSFFVLKHKSRERFAWSAFVVTVVVFSIITWSMAMAFRPTNTRVEHFSVIDIDAQQEQVQASSWLSLFVASHDVVDVRIQDNPSSTSNQNLIAAPGFPPVLTGTGFLDPQSYSFASNAPGDVQIPFRATAKQLAVRWKAHVADPMPPGYESDKLINGEIELVSQFPKGTLTHHLPKALEATCFIYCPGNGQTPIFWRENDPWKPGMSMLIDRRRIAVQDRLILRPTRSTTNDWGGYLWTLQQNRLTRLFNNGNEQLQLAPNEIRTNVEMLSFYDMLPPPAYWKTATAINLDSPMHYLRSLGRELDWSKLTVFPRLIVIGYMEDAPLPVPMLVNHKPVKGNGRVAVRWIYHLAPATVQAQTTGTSNNGID